MTQFTTRRGKVIETTSFDVDIEQSRLTVRYVDQADLPRWAQRAVCRRIPRFTGRPFRPEYTHRC